MVRQLRDGPGPRIMVILGASGAGKSSFMRAGILPRLRRESEHFHVLPALRPGRRALGGDGGLVSVLFEAQKTAGKDMNRADIREAVERGSEAIRNLLSNIAQTTEEQSSRPAFVLPLDQDFEALSIAEGVRRAARDWSANGGDAEWLTHEKGRLETAEVIMARSDFSEWFTSDDRSYLAA